MMLRRFALLRTATRRASAALAALAVIGIGVAATNTEAVVAGRFTAALEALPRQEVAGQAVSQPLVAGTEAYWLNKRRHDSADAALEPAAWSASQFAAGLISVGDRITISNAKGERTLEVVSLSDVGLDGDGNVAAPHKIAVTCRDLGNPGGRLVTFEVPAGAISTAAKSARTL